MERFTVVIISTLFITASPTVIASEASAKLATKDGTESTYSAETSPVNLVYLAHRGYFTEQGIPSSQALVSAYSLGKISAEKLVQIGVETGRVSSDTLKNRKYISTVESMLNTLKTR